MRQAGKYRGEHSLPPLPDYIQPGVRILLVGINPGIRSASLGHHFAGYSNRFWKILYRARLVPEPLTYLDDWRLPSWGLGVTNLVPRASAGIHELTRQDYNRGRAGLLRKVRRYRPHVVAILGLTLYAVLFGKHRGNKPTPGLLQESLCDAAVFLLPNPSGRNAHYSLAAMVRMFRELKQYAFPSV